MLWLFLTPSRFELCPKLLENIKDQTTLVTQAKNQPHYSGSWVFGLKNSNTSFSNALALFLFDMDSCFPSFIYAAFTVVAALVEGLATSYRPAKAGLSTSSTEADNSVVFIGVKRDELIHALDKLFGERTIYVKLADPRSWCISDSKTNAKDLFEFPAKNELRQFAFSSLDILAEWLTVFDFPVQLKILE